MWVYAFDEFFDTFYPRIMKEPRCVGIISSAVTGFHPQNLTHYVSDWNTCSVHSFIYGYVTYILVPSLTQILENDAFALVEGYSRLQPMPSCEEL